MVHVKFQNFREDQSEQTTMKTQEQPFFSVSAAHSFALASMGTIGLEFPLGQNTKNVEERLTFYHEKFQNFLGGPSLTEKS